MRRCVGYSNASRLVQCGITNGQSRGEICCDTGAQGFDFAMRRPRLRVPRSESESESMSSDESAPDVAKVSWG
jgi:hypothetical protein